MREYTVGRAAETPPLTGDLDGPWADAPTLAIDAWPWDTGRDRQATTARLLYDDEALYLQYVCEDTHLEATATELNGEVWTDSCVEFFAAPAPGERPGYVNFEANCCGAFLMGYGPGRGQREFVAPEVAAGVRVATPVPGPTKEPSPDDDGWWLAAALPFGVLSALAGHRVAPSPGDRWRANCYRCGGRTEFAAWNPVEAPDPDFHRPEQFGAISFA